MQTTAIEKMKPLFSQLETFFEELDQRIAARHPTCRHRGDCCQFDRYGHKLYVTTLELAYFSHRHGGRLQEDFREDGNRSKVDGIRLPIGSEPMSPGCPFQKQNLCTAREGRPMGCRIFFCESESAGWQQELSEWGILQLRRIHESARVEYRYQEWLTALSSLNFFSDASRSMSSVKSCEEETVL